MCAPASTLTDDFWDELLTQIFDNQVVPVLGPGILTMRDEATGKDELLHSWLLPQLAKRLGLTLDAAPTSLNQIMLQHLIKGGKRLAMYQALRTVLSNARSSLRPGQALLDLASMWGFRLYLTTLFDPLPALGLAEKRPDFSIGRDVFAFHPNKLQDLPSDQTHPLLYHVMGQASSYPDFAVWDEDHMEFICEIQNRAGDLPNFFGTLKERSLLLIGSPFSDWVVRFFLRVARQSRLSERTGVLSDYLADDQNLLEASMVVYFDKIANTTSLINFDPQNFVSELKRRWTEKYGDTPPPPPIPAGNESFTQLRNLLTQLYTSQQDIIRIASDVGIPPGQLINDKSINIWDELLRECQRRSLIRNLIEVVSQEYSNRANELAALSTSLIG